MIIQYSCISWSIHNMSSLLCCHSSLPKKRKKKKKKRAANIQKTPEPEAGVIKENKCF